MQTEKRFVCIFYALRFFNGIKLNSDLISGRFDEFFDIGTKRLTNFRFAVILILKYN